MNDLPEDAEFGGDPKSVIAEMRAHIDSLPVGLRYPTLAEIYIDINTTLTSLVSDAEALQEIESAIMDMVIETTEHYVNDAATIKRELGDQGADPMVRALEKGRLDGYRQVREEHLHPEDILHNDPRRMERALRFLYSTIDHATDHPKLKMMEYMSVYRIFCNAEIMIGESPLREDILTVLLDRLDEFFSEPEKTPALEAIYNGAPNKSDLQKRALQLLSERPEMAAYNAAVNEEIDGVDLSEFDNN